METVLEMINVTKCFKNKKAVDGVDFKIRKGETNAILGPNGAGKTTSIMMMLGLLEPTDGKIRLFGGNPGDKRVKERTGALFQDTSMIDALKTREVIEMFRSYYPSPLSFSELADLAGFTKVELSINANKLSGGQKRRLAFALALAGDPDLLFLDEPTAGLDVTSRRHFWSRVAELKKKGKTIIFTTHYLEEVDEAADRIILFQAGRIAGDGSPDEIKAALTKKYVSFSAANMNVQNRWLAIPGVDTAEEKNGRIYLGTKDTDTVLKALIALHQDARDIRIDVGSLDDAFEQLTGIREAG